LRGVRELRETAVGLNFELNNADLDSDPTKISSILVEIEDLNIVPKYLKDEEPLDVGVQLSLETGDKTTKKASSVRFKNGEVIGLEKIRSRSKDISSVTIDGVKTDVSKLNGTVKISVNHSDISEQTYRQKFRISSDSVFVPSSGVSRWNFEQDLSDDWDNNYGENSGTSFVNSSKIGNYSLSCSGGDHIDVGTLPLSGSMSVSCWINPRNFNDQSFIVNNYGGSGNSEQHYLLSVGAAGADLDQPSFFVDDGSEGQEAIASTISTGQWCHLVGVFDDENNKVVIYKNGEFESESTYSSTPDFNERSTWIGAEQDNNGWYTEGKIDDVRIYNKALSGSEINNLYENGKIK
jgi:hypothetical protein